MQVRYSPLAQSDLASIWEYTAAHWDMDQADRYVRRVASAVDELADDPGRGHPGQRVRSSYRYLAVGSHLVFYLATQETIDVIRVLHQRMDPARHL